MSPFSCRGRPSTNFFAKMRPLSESTTATTADGSAFKEHTSPPPPLPYDELSPPPLNYTLKTRSRELYIGIFFTLIFIEAGVLPLVLFYSLRWGAHLSITKNLAIITSLVGTVSGLKLGQRTYYLWFRNGHETRRPIGAGRWGVDFFHILISTALGAFFVPLIVGSSLTPARTRIVAMALPCFMLIMCIPMIISGLFPHHFRLPFRVSSFPPHQLLPPLTYTIVEDVIAVDGGGCLEFRQAWRHRYESSRVMRKLLRDVALMWGISGVVLAGGLIAIAWTTSIDVGYGISYGIPWIWAGACTIITIYWVKKELAREKREWADVVKVHREKHLFFVEGPVDREADARVMERRRKSMSQVPAGQGQAEEAPGRMSTASEPIPMKRRSMTSPLAPHSSQVPQSCPSLPVDHSQQQEHEQREGEPGGSDNRV